MKRQSLWVAFLAVTVACGLLFPLGTVVEAAKDRVVVAFHIATQLLLRALGVVGRIVIHLLDQLVVAVDRRVVLEDIEDEALLHRLFHGVTVEWVVLHGAVGLRVRLAEDLQGLVLGSRGEGKVERSLP